MTGNPLKGYLHLLGRDENRLLKAVFFCIIKVTHLICKKQEFSRIVLCHQLWLKTEADEIQKDKKYAGWTKIFG